MSQTTLNQPSSKFPKWPIFGMSMLVVVLLSVCYCYWLRPQMAKWELEEQGVMPDVYGQALLAACEKNDVKTVSLLITAGADVNKANKDDETPLYRASLRGHTEIVKLLIEAGAKRELLKELAKRELLKKYEFEADNDEEALLAACERNDAEIASLLIMAGVDVNTARNLFLTPLHLVALGGQTEIAKLLIAAGADVNEADMNGLTPLHVSACAGQTEIVKLLIKAGADVNNADNKYGYTPLKLAALKGHKEIVELLKLAGAKE